MGWYGGQEGAKRSRWYDQSRAAYSRFLDTRRKNAKLTSFKNKVVGKIIIMSHAPIGILLLLHVIALYI